MDFPSLPKLTLDGTNAPLEIDPVELSVFYIPLADLLVQKSSALRRFIIGIAGPPGSGKTAFTALLTAVINVRIGHAAAVNVGLDGWHYLNSYLDTHTVLRDGILIPLRRVKGAPESFDTDSALLFLRSVRQGKALAYPLYSREWHDPIPSAGSLTLEHQIILMEGNYLLLNAPGWEEFRTLFDLSIFITAPRDELVASLRARHLRGGKDPDTVEKHLRFSDLPNLDLILSQSSPANIQIIKFDSRRIEKIIVSEFI
jgi:pantothenate kinase